MGDLAMMAAQPSEYQRNVWWEFIAITDEPVLTESGALVWMGWCPLCDKDQLEDRLTARFDFRRGLLYCEAEGGPCYKQRSMSLNNALVRMSSGQR